MHTVQKNKKWTKWKFKCTINYHFYSQEFLMKRSVFSSIVLAASILLLLVSCKKKEEKKKDNTPEGFVRISAGTFKMGSKAGDKFEKPAHQVKLTHDIYMSDHELTQAEYKAYCIFGSSQPSEKLGIGDNYPAYYVSSYDAVVYCNLRSIAEGLEPAFSMDGVTDPREWKGIVEGADANAGRFCGPKNGSKEWDAIIMNTSVNGYRLPTEAEWEYAACAGADGSEKSLWAGTDDSSILGQYAWYRENSGKKIHEVKGKQPNAWGLYDMAGNVWEWCWDWSNTNEPYTEEEQTDPTGATEPDKKNGRIEKSGSYLSADIYCRTFNRYSNYRNYRYSDDGIRICRTATNAR